MTQNHTSDNDPFPCACINGRRVYPVYKVEGAPTREFRNVNAAVAYAERLRPVTPRDPENAA